MQPLSPTRRWVLGALLMKATMAGPDERVLAEVREMEARQGLKLVNPGGLRRGPLSDLQHPEGHIVGVHAVAPDGATIIYKWPAHIHQPPGIPFLVVENVEERAHPIVLEGQSASLAGISAGAKIVVVKAVSLVKVGRKSLLALDLHSGMVVHDLTRYVTEFELPDLESISVSGQGTLTALGSRERIQVIQIPSGNSIYAGSGRFPKLSPDGKRLAYVERERLYVHSLADGSSRELLRGARVMGSGGWSPDGRFLAAGAWTKRIALEKRQIIVDTANGDYGAFGTLGEGDYGDEFVWISTKLLIQEDPR